MQNNCTEEQVKSLKYFCPFYLAFEIANAQMPSSVGVTTPVLWFPVLV